MKTFGHSGHWLFFILLSWHISAFAMVLTPAYKPEGVMEPDQDGKMNPDHDYEHFSGRVSDKDDTSRLLKIQVENNNTKFFRPGDLVHFKVNRREDRDYCKAFVRAVEDFHFTLYVDSFAPCYSISEYFRRGTVLNFYSKILSQRVFEAMKYREELMTRKKDFLHQLNDINNFLWYFDEHKVKTAADYDEKINALQREKRKALDDLITLKQERLNLQNELMKKLNELDGSMNFYRIERQEKLTDRWNLDHDQGLPFGQRPQEMRDAKDILMK